MEHNQKIKRQNYGNSYNHYLEEAEALSDEIGIMVKGKLVALGTAKEIKAKAGKEKFEDAFITLCENGGNVK